MEVRAAAVPEMVQERSVECGSDAVSPRGGGNGEEGQFVVERDRYVDG